MYHDNGEQLERLAVVFDDSKALAPEKFQGLVLRPILKMKNLLLLQIMKDELKRRDPEFGRMNEVRQKQIIDDAVKFRNALREKFLKVILDEMTESERGHFLASRKEFSSRLTQMLVERFCKQIDQLV